MKNLKKISNDFKIYLYSFLIIVLVVCIITVVVIKYKYSSYDSHYDDEIVDDSNKYNDITNYSWVRRNIEFYVENRVTSKVDNMFDKYILFEDNIMNLCVFESNECSKYNYKIDDKYLYIYVDNYSPYEYKINDDILTFYVKDKEYDAVYYFARTEG